MLFLPRGVVRGLGRGEAAGVGLDAPAVVSAGGASLGTDSAAGAVSSSRSMTCWGEGEAEVASGRGGDGGGDASADGVERREKAEATDLSESEVGETEPSLVGRVAFLEDLVGLMVEGGGRGLRVGRVVCVVCC